MSVVLRRAGLSVLVAVVMLGGGVQAQVIPARAVQPQSPADAPPVSLKVTVTISRYEGEKKTASLPFVLWVNTGRDGSNIRMSNDVPIPTITMKDGVSTTSYIYRSVGTNIDCSASVVSDGLYRISLGIEDSQVGRPIGVQAVQMDGTRGTVQSIRLQHQPILRDSQTVQFAVATDKTTGEVIKLDVTLNVVK